MPEKQPVQQMSYTSEPACSASALAQWNFYTRQALTSLVLPDGCRDFIVKQHPDSGQTYFVSDLSVSSFSVFSLPNTRMRGIRLRPGVQIDQNRLNQWLCSNNLEKLFLKDQIDEFCFQNACLAEALDCIESDITSVSSVAKQLGISTRSLQRLIKTQTGMTPTFWLALARARKTARALLVSNDLNDVAFNFSFADQAHMSREIKRWFNLTPLQIKSSKDMGALLTEQGYG